MKEQVEELEALVPQEKVERHGPGEAVFLEARDSLNSYVMVPLNEEDSLVLAITPDPKEPSLLVANLCRATLWMENGLNTSNIMNLYGVLGYAGVGEGDDPKSVAEELREEALERLGEEALKGSYGEDVRELFEYHMREEA